MSSKREIVYIDGSRGDKGDFPVAVTYTQVFGLPSGEDDVVSEVVDPVFNGSLYSNLYGRVMTLIEATTDAYKLKAVKDLFSKELNDWSNDVFQSAREITTGGDSSDNLYTRKDRSIK